MGEVQLVDFDQIAMLGGLAEPTVAEILRDFLTTFEKQLPDLEKRINEGANTCAKEEAHKLKGAARTCGFDALGRHAEELESAAEEERLSEVSEWTLRAKELLGLTRDALDAGSGAL